jgi:aromatic ring-opening dioxygenase catalytic subunit (LigB family)
LLSLKSTYDPEEHTRIGQALAPLRDEGVLIMGSGMTYHNMAGMGRSDSAPIAEAFEGYLASAIAQSDWASLPCKRYSRIQRFIGRSRAEDGFVPESMMGSWRDAAVTALLTLSTPNNKVAAPSP